MTKIFLTHLFLYNLVFQIFRCTYLLYYHSTVSVNSKIIYFQILFHGIRFDQSVIFLFLSPFLVLSFIFPLNKFKIYRNLWIYTPIFLLVYGIFHLVGDFIYFENAQKHLGYEGFVFMGKDFIVLLASAFESHFLLLSIGFPLGFLMGFGLIKLFSKISYHKPNSYKEAAIIFILWLVVSIIGIRGGVQKSFISPSNAIVTENPLLNQFILNGVFTTIQEIGTEKFSRIQEMKTLEAVAHTRNVIQYDGATFENDIYPIYRKTKYLEKSKKPDILMVLLESWPTKYVLQKFEGKEITPNFNKLVKEGVYFSKFFANGGRTSNGLVSILSGFPDRPGKSLIHSRYSLNHFTPIGTLLKDKGYETFFYYGGELSFENITPVIKNWGFDTILDLGSFEKSGKYLRGVWGYNDYDVYKKMLEEINSETSNDKPKLRVCLTLSTHHPFQVPDESFNLFKPDSEENRFINSMYYADWSLGEFIKEFKKSEKYKNTVIIFVSDHTSHRTLNYFEDRNIPFLVLNNGIKAEINPRVSSQIDILPTILGIVGGEFYFSSLGRDIFSDNREGYAYIAFGNIFGWAEKNILFMDTVEEHNGLYFTISEPYISKGPCKKNPYECVESHTKAKAFLNLSETLLKKNLIAPPK
jgi:phosphoglycerol transferase MdoB-like AlkP superfamily enzyme